MEEAAPILAGPILAAMAPIHCMDIGSYLRILSLLDAESMTICRERGTVSIRQKVCVHSPHSQSPLE